MSFQADHRRLLPKYQKKLEKPVKQAGEASLTEIQEFIDTCMREGGKPFLERCKKYGVNEKGFPLRLDKWFEEILELIGDFRISETYVTGCAQLGKTLSHSLLLTDTLIHGQINAAWFYVNLSQLQNNVPEQFKPIVVNWLENYKNDTGVDLAETSDRTNSQRYSVGKATGIFAYTSTSKTTSSREGLAKVGNSAASFTANLLFLEECSQHTPEARQATIRRTDASVIPTRPLRALGTPGSSQGIEKEIETCHYYFQPHYTCPHCNITAPLHPFGCLLREFEMIDPLGNKVKTFLSVANKPVKWLHHNERSPVDSAYIGCSNCTKELSEETRVNSHLRCIKTGVSAREFIDNLPKKAPKERYKIGIYFSPLCRRTKSNLAKDIIAEGISSANGDDFVQQRLGLPSIPQNSNISIALLERCIQAPKIRIHERHQPKELILSGIDMGRSSDWMMVARFCFPLNYKELSTNEIIERSQRHVLFGGDVLRDEIGNILEKFEVEYGIIDNEPSREASFNVARNTVLEMADQRSGLKEITKKSTVKDGGLEFDCHLIRTEKFFTQMFDAYFTPSEEDRFPLYRLPDSWDRYLSDRSELSPIRHLTSISRDPIKGFVRPNDKVDDLAFANMFMEAAFYIYLSENVGNDDTNWLKML